jgi:serine/threonine-protein kinase SRPK3
VTIPRTSLEELVSMVGPKDEHLFLEFVRKMLHWLPEKREQPSELLKDSWLTSET